MAPASRTADTKPTPTQRGKKKPPSPANGPGGGKTTSVCEASVEGTPVPAMAMPDALHVYHDHVVAQLGAASILFGDAHDFWLASLEGRALRPDSVETLALAGERMRGAWALPPAIFNARTPSIDPALTLAHLRRGGRPIVVADSGASHWHDAALNACWAWGSRWRADLRASGGDVHRAARRLAQWWRRLEGDSERWPSPERLRAEADLEYRAAVLKRDDGLNAGRHARSIKAHQLYGMPGTGGMDTGTFAKIRNAAGLDLGLTRHNARNQEFTASELRRLIQALEDGRYIDGIKAQADRWRHELRKLAES